MLILVGLVLLEWLNWSNEHRQAVRMTAPAEERKQEGSATTIEPQLIEDQQYYSEIVHRTLFREDRQAYQGKETAQGVATTAPPIPEIRLTGVVLTDAEKPLAVIHDKKQKKSEKLQVGDSLGEWVIQAIERDSILLSWQDQTAKIELRKY
jgi:hypothetical protein